jgi:hypothetical protein
MAWKKGETGNPTGRGNAERPWREAIQRAVKRRLEGKDSPQALDKLADAIVSAGLAGDIAALREIGDRLDGKPAQGVTVSGDDNLSPIRTSLEVMFVKADNES